MSCATIEEVIDANIENAVRAYRKKIREFEQAGLIELGQYRGEVCEHDHGLYYDVTDSVWRCSRCKQVMP